MEKLLFVSLILSFFSVLLVLPNWIKRAKEAGIVGRDIHKQSKEKVAESGGIVVIWGFLIGVLFYIALKTFYFKTTENLIEIFAMISTVMLISFIGLVDDVLGWKIGLTGKIRIILIILSAIPLVVINAGNSKVLIPFNGITDIGLLYPLFIVPLAILCASVGFNTIAGYNGLEAGQGIILLSTLAVTNYFMGKSWLSLIALCMVFALIAFFIFNKFPAKVFPGNSITFAVGALFAMLAILGNVERFALFIFSPYILEVFLKIRGKLKKESFAFPQRDGSLELRYEKFYGIEHIIIWLLKRIKKDGKVYERDVVYFIFGLQIIICLLGLIIFGIGLR